MKPREIREMSDEQLELTVKDTIKHLFQLRFQSATDRLETPSEIRKARRDIARVKTLQRQRELVELDTATDAELKALQELIAKGQSAPGKPFVGKRKAKRLQTRVDKLLGAAPARKGK